MAQTGILTESEHFPTDLASPVIGTVYREDGAAQLAYILSQPDAPADVNELLARLPSLHRSVYKLLYSSYGSDGIRPRRSKQQETEGLCA